MNLELAILNVLDTTPRPISAGIVLAYVPGFFDCPRLAAVRGEEAARLAIIAETLERLKAVDEVLAVPSRDGRLWKITPNGKARIA